MGWKLCRCCDTHYASRDRSNITKKQGRDLRRVPVEFTAFPSTQSALQHMEREKRRFEAASPGCTKGLGDGKNHSIDLSLTSRHAHRAIWLSQVKPARVSTHSVQEGSAFPASKGGTITAWGLSQKKIPSRRQWQPHATLACI